MSETLKVNLKKKIADFWIQAEFSVQSGERLALMGRSGSGKTSLLRMIAGLSDYEGEVFLGNELLNPLPPQKREIAMVFQDLALFPAMNVLENATFALRVRGVSRKEREARAEKLLRQMDLWKQKEKSIETLSGGERQRLALVRALIWKPRLILMDEPFSALDSKTRLNVQADCLALLREHPVPMILVTHDEDDFKRVSTGKLEVKESNAGSRRLIHRAD